MKRKLILSLVAGLIPVSLVAQDDLYFIPKKSSDKIESSYDRIGGSDRPTSVRTAPSRDVDEYNRRGMDRYFQTIGTDSLGNDIIAFVSDSVSSDTLQIYPERDIEYDMDDDYTYSRRMSRFDDYYWYDPWFYSYGYGSGPYWSPWNYRWGWYDPWYYSWYDPWYYGWHTGWGYYHCWNYPYYGWGHPVHVGGGGYRPIYAYHNGVTGTSNHGKVSRGSTLNRTNNYGGGGNRGVANSGKGNFGGRRQTLGSTNSRSSYNSSGSSNSSSFGGSRNSNSNSSRSSSYTPSSNSAPSYSGGSFGGSHSSGGGSFSGGGGSRSGGGGHFGGRR